MRRWWLAILLSVAALAAAWMVPGLTSRAASGLLAGQGAPQRQADSQVASPQAPPPSTAQTPPASRSSTPRSHFTGLFGIAAILGIGIALSHNRRAIRWRVVGWGLTLQVLFAIFVLRIPAGQQLFRALGSFVTAVLHYSYAGSQFVFGELGKPDSSLGVVFAFQILPAIIFVSALF